MSENGEAGIPVEGAGEGAAEAIAGAGGAAMPGGGVAATGKVVYATAEECRDDIQHYAPECMVLLDCEHVRVMRGETDEVIGRMRSADAEREVIAVVDSLPAKAEPDWFVERWLEDERQLVAVIVFENAEMARFFRDAMKAAVKKGEAEGRRLHLAVACRKSLVEQELRHFNHEWTIAHRKSCEKVKATVEKLGVEYTHRVVLGYVKYDPAVENDDRKRFDVIAKMIADKFPTEDGKLKFSWSVVKDETKGKLRVAFGVQNKEQVKELCALCDSEAEGRSFAPSDLLAIWDWDDRESEVDRTIVATIASKLEADERKAAALAEARERAKKGGAPEMKLVGKGAPAAK